MNGSPSSLNVINLWAGPGAGKSTTAAGLFNLMKHRGLKVELVTEAAKDLVYREDWRTLQNQLYLLGKQDNRLRRLVGHVDWAINDSPLPLCLIYATEEYGQQWFATAVYGAYARYTNINIGLTRTKAYQTYGRRESAGEARELDVAIAGAMEAVAPCVITWHVKANEEAPWQILKLLEPHL